MLQCWAAASGPAYGREVRGSGGRKSLVGSRSKATPRYREFGEVSTPQKLNFLLRWICSLWWCPEKTCWKATFWAGGGRCQTACEDVTSSDRALHNAQCSETDSVRWYHDVCLFGQVRFTVVTSFFWALLPRYLSGKMAAVRLRKIIGAYAYRVCYLLSVVFRWYFV